MARPRKEIEQKQFEGLCRIQCTEKEICSVLDVTDKTLVAWCKRTYGVGFSDAYEKFASGGRMSLRRYQFDCAKKGNATMLIWLGKQYLGQKDDMRVDVGSEQGVQIYIPSNGRDETE